MIPLDDLTPATVLARAGELVDQRRAALVDDLQVCLAWADLHGEEPTVRVPGGDRLVQLGGDGTPPVRDLVLEELSVARRVHVANTRAATADALDLRHRLPRLWAATVALECEPWLVRKIARMSRRLPATAVTLVDAAVAAALHQAPGRVIAIAEAKIIEADTAGYETLLAAKRRERGVWLSRLTPADPDDPDSGRGTQTLYAKLAPEHALWIDRLLDTLTDLLAENPALVAQHGLTEDPGRDEIRAVALGMLARPHEVAELLDTGEVTAAASRQRATIYLHLHEASLLAGQGVARAEAFGPILLTRLADLVGHTHITLTPVIDLNTGATVTGYEHPTTLRERALLRTDGDVFPYAAATTGTSRRLDLDHVIPYDPGGPPGQTGDHNTAPLTRRSHRAKTHHPYQVEQLGPASYLWTTPHGLTCLVNPEGTRPLRPDQAELLRAYHAPTAA